MAQGASTPDTWLHTSEVLAELRISRSTLDRLVRSGQLKQGVHFRRINPTRGCSPRLWHRERTITALDAA